MTKALRQLQKVWYEIFCSDRESLDANPEEHTLDREIRLEFDSGEPAFLTWGSEPVQYSVCVSARSSFATPIPVVRDMSDSPMWHELIGEAIDLEFLDSAHQILRVGNRRAFRYVSSQENGMWELDVITVSIHQPVLP